MSSSTHIIKRAHLDAEQDPASAAFSENDGRSHTSRSRVAARHVHLDAEAERDEEEAAPYRLKGILRKSQAYLHEDVVALDIPQFTPDFPLAEPPEPQGQHPEEEEEAAAPVDVDALKAEWDEAWEARLERAVNEAHHDGFELGSQHAQQALQAEVDATVHTCLEAAGQFSKALQAYIARCEPLLAQLAFQVAETILDAPLPTHIKSVSTKALSDAIEHLAADPPVDITLHPVDFLHLQETGLIEQLRATHEKLRWHPDSNLKQGDWTVQSPNGTIRRLRQELMATLRQRIQSIRPPESELSGKQTPPPDDIANSS